MTSSLVLAASVNNAPSNLVPINAASVAGANLPISYNISSLTGTVVYAAPNGSSSASCTSSAPCTVTRAISQVPANGTVVIRGGLYRDQRNLSVTKSGVRIVAYPGEVPEFRGSVSVPTSGWTTEGNLKYRSYAPRPVTNGGGLSFGDDAAANKQTGCRNLNGDCSGLYPDQVWLGATALKQVLSKSAVVGGKFYVDKATKRLYLSTNDSARSDIETSRPGAGASDRDRLFHISATNVKIEGLRVTRYSPSASDYGVIVFESSASSGLLNNIDISHLPYDGVHVGAGNSSTTMRNISMSYVGWQGVNTNQTDNFTLDYAKITNMDPFDEFTSSPASGALKTSRNRNTTVKNSYIANNKSHGLWFDQSNINTIVANSAVIDNKDAGIFFEISDGLLLVNNFIRSSGSATPLRLIGSSGLRLVNNTSIGGAYPLGVYTDDRSAPGCANRPTSNPCQISSDLQTRYPKPTSMDWMPRIDLMVNNIFAHPTGSTDLCAGVVSAACIMTYHSGGGNAPLNTIIHKADPARGIPQSVIDGNVYANGSGVISRVTRPAASYSTVSAHSAAISNATGISVDSKSRHGSSWVNSDGTPSSSLAAVHSQAVSVPTNAEINKYIAAGTRHYGALSSSVSTPVTTTQPIATTTTTRPVPTTTRPVPTTTRPVVTPLPTNRQEVVAMSKMLKDHGLVKVRQLSWENPTLRVRAYFPYYGLFYIAADVTASVDAQGNYRIVEVQWIASLTPIN